MRAAKARRIFNLAILMLPVLLLISPCSLSAATIVSAMKDPGSNDSGNERCSLTLSGPIVPDDEERFRQAIGDRVGGKGYPITLCLNSDGGNLNAGIAIADIVFEQIISTLVLPGHACISSCSLIFMAGVSVSTDGIGVDRSIAPTARLGFHAPRPPIAKAGGDADELMRAYDAALEIVGRQLLRIANRYAVGRDWNGRPIKSTLINKMMLSTGSHLFFIDSVGRAAEFEIGIDNAAVPPGDKIGRYRHMCENTLAESVDEATAKAFFNQPIESIERRKVDGNDQVYIDVKRNRERVCTVEGHRVSVQSGRSTYDRHVPDWYAWPPDTPIAALEKGPDGRPKVPVAAKMPAWCSGKVNAAEQIVCENPELAAYDFDLNRLYQDLTKIPGAPKPEDVEQQRAWAGERNKCGRDYVCVHNAYDEARYRIRTAISEARKRSR